MANPGTLHIKNGFTKPITIFVSLDGWNCCDAPLPGQNVGYLEVNGTQDLPYLRKDGHSCDGKQGNFSLLINSTMRVDLNFDSGGNMADPNPVGCNAGLSGQNVLIVSA